MLGSHRFIDSLRLEGASGDHLANPPAQGCPGLCPVKSLLSPRMECQQSLGNLLECSITLTVKKVFSYFSCISVYPHYDDDGKKNLYLLKNEDI